MSKMPDETKQGYVAQAMWDEPEREWFDVTTILSTALDAAKSLEIMQTNFEKRRHRPECVRKGILATRIVRRTVTDEPWPDQPPLPNVTPVSFTCNVECNAESEHLDDVDPHRCRLPSGHEGEHICNTCGIRWDSHNSLRRQA